MKSSKMLDLGRWKSPARVYELGVTYIYDVGVKLWCSTKPGSKAILYLAVGVEMAGQDYLHTIQWMMPSELEKFDLRNRKRHWGSQYGPIINLDEAIRGTAAIIDGLAD